MIMTFAVDQVERRKLEVSRTEAEQLGTTLTGKRSRLVTYSHNETLNTNFISFQR